METNEIWKNIPSTDDFYQASNLGRIRRAKLPKNSPWSAKIGHILKPQMIPRGYFFIMPRINGKIYQRYVHRLVCEAFIGPCPKRKQVNHKNGIKFDNRIENLEYVTPSENDLHCTRILKKRMGENHPMAKLSNEDIKYIRNYPYRRGTKRDCGSMNDLAKKFNVHKCTIFYILKNKTWNHI